MASSTAAPATPPLRLSLFSRSSFASDKGSSQNRQRLAAQSMPSSPLLSPSIIAAHRRSSLADASISTLDGPADEQVERAPCMTRRPGPTSLPRIDKDPDRHGPERASLRQISSGTGPDWLRMRNPAFALHVTPQWTLELTYAAILQYASIVIAAYHIYLSHVSTTISNMSYVLSIVLFAAGLATLEVRRRAERVGLRRTALVLCSALFATALAVAYQSSSHAQDSWYAPAHVDDSTGDNESNFHIWVWRPQGPNSETAYKKQTRADQALLGRTQTLLAQNPPYQDLLQQLCDVQEWRLLDKEQVYGGRYKIGIRDDNHRPGHKHTVEITCNDNDR